MRRHKYPGNISYEFWIACGMCNASKPMTEYTHAKCAEEARNMGWRWNGAPYGWVCPSCLERRKEV